MENKDLSDIGNQIRKAVENAISSKDFEELNKNIADSVNVALKEVRENVKGAVKHAGAEAGKWSEQVRPEQIKPEQIKREVAKPEIRVNYPSRVAGILLTVFGSIGLGVFGIMFIVFSVVGMFTPIHVVMTGVATFFAIMAAFFAGMLFVGIRKLGKLRRLRRYVAEAGERMYCTVEQLSAAVGKSGKYVTKDVERMIKSGLLPEAHLDDGKTCLMLNKDTYRQYLEVRRNYEEQQLNKKKAEEIKRIKQSSKEKEMPEELRQMIDSGRNYIRILREANDAIPGESISQKLSKLEDVIGRIFETVEKHPEQMGEMERFMDYYLPTTVKLVNAYRDFDSVNTIGGNVEAAKLEIEQTLDTINQAFERLLDSLYEDAALDASTDASVLQAMLKSEGYAESDFKQSGEKK